MIPLQNRYNEREVALQQFLTSSLLIDFCVMVQNIFEVAWTVESSSQKKLSPMGTDVEGIALRDDTYAGILQKHVF